MGLRMMMRQHLSGWTETIFPEVEEWLQEDGDHWQALAYIGGRSNMKRYRSAVDYIYSMSSPQARLACLRYYKGKGPQAIEILSDREINIVQAQLLAMCEISYQAWCHRREKGWAKPGWKTILTVIEYMAA